MQQCYVILYMYDRYSTKLSGTAAIVSGNTVMKVCASMLHP